MINRLAIIGVGLIGGSLARALRRAKWVNEVVGCGRGRENLQQAVELGVIDRFETDPAQAVLGADMVVVAVSLGATETIFSGIANSLDEDAIVTDVGSTKQSVVDAAERCLGPHLLRFVPAHPIAGTEHSGVAASFAELFQDHRVIVAPTEKTDIEACEKVSDMWRATGAEVVTMSVAHHDAVFAATSHLPHLLAYALVDCLASMEPADGASSEEIFAFAAGGFRDFTRIASSNPEMWRDIALANRDALLEMCARYERTFEQLRAAISQRDGDKILEVFSRAKAARDRCVVAEANRQT